MWKKAALWVVLALVVLAPAGFGGWLVSLPSQTGTASSAPPVPASETKAMLAALRPTKRERPLIAVVGINDATETTDYLMPTGILRRANVADVMMLATAPGPVRLYPTLKVEPDATIEEFDLAHPEGADYVIVPAMSRDDDPAMLAWLRKQAERGAKIIGVCAGAKVVGAAGLLDGKRATTHWYYKAELLDRSPTIEHIADRRMVWDNGVATTTGISASMPMMLALVEAIAGKAKAEEVAWSLGARQWDARHRSDAFKITRSFAMTVLANRAVFWNREAFGIRLDPGVDAVSLALVTDAWARTYRSSIVTFAPSTLSVVTAQGIRVLPDQSADDWPANRRVSIFSDQPAAVALDLTLEAIAGRYGEPTASVVAMQLEYPRPSTAR